MDGVQMIQARQKQTTELFKGEVNMKQVKSDFEKAVKI